jgi:hypothetical protein
MKFMKCIFFMKFQWISLNKKCATNELNALKKIEIFGQVCSRLRDTQFWCLSFGSVRDEFSKSSEREFLPVFLLFRLFILSWLNLRVYYSELSMQCSR